MNTKTPDVAAISNALARAWLEDSRATFKDDQPFSVATAYEIQDRVHEQLGFPTAGWKVGLPGQVSQRRLRVVEPIIGRIYGGPRLKTSPASFKRAEFDPLLLEAEITWRIGSDLPPRKTPYDKRQIADAITAAICAIDLVGSRWQGRMFDMPPAAWVADNSSSGAFVTGTEISDWKSVDWTTVPVEMWVDGKLAGASQDIGVRGDPLETLTWAANHLSTRGIGLHAGEIVSTGSASVPVPRDGHTEAVAQFGQLGQARTTFD